MTRSLSQRKPQLLTVKPIFAVVAFALAFLSLHHLAQQPTVGDETVADSDAQEATADDGEFKIRIKSGQDRQISYYVGRGLEDSHLLRREIDDEISQRALKILLKRLDSRKYYFLQSDIDEFNAFSTDLDDMLMARDVTLGKVIFRRLIQRIDERYEDIEQILAGELSFDVEEDVVADGKETTFAGTAVEARERWRKRLKYELLVLESAQAAADAASDSDEDGEDSNDESEEDQSEDSEGEGTSDEEATDEEAAEEEATEDEDPREVLRKRYANFRRRMRQTDSDEVLEYYLTAITSSFDPHSTYFSPSSLEDFRIRMGLNYQGIGAELSDEDGRAIIQRVMPNGGAEKGGQLKAGDQIVSVGQGADGKMSNVVNLKLQDIIEKIRGPEGTIVRLGVIPGGSGDVQIYNITRTRIELGDNAAKSTIMDVERDGEKLKVGVIDLPSFYVDMTNRGGRATASDMARLLQEFQEEEVDAVIVDLRRNGGGSLSEAVAATGLFIARGPVVQVKDTVNGVIRHSDRDPGIAWDGPLVVLTSRFSASASEIFAGALQDYGRAIVVGDTSTHGKGTVQSLQELGPLVFKVDPPMNLGALKITIQQFYRPSGVSTQNRGVESDIVLPSFSEHLAEGESSLDYAIPFDEIQKMRYTVRDDVTPGVIESLNEKSNHRVAESESFEELQKRIAEYRENEDRETVPLERAAFLELQEQVRRSREEQRRLLTRAVDDDDVVARDYYFEEVLQITADLAELSAE